VSESRITKSDRDAIIRVLKMREATAKTEADQRAAELIADFEAQLAAEHKANAPAWADLTEQASKGIAELDAELARRCRELGIPEDWRPSLTLGWSARGENASKARRVELRKVAETRIEAQRKKALAFIARQHTELATQVVAGSLESGEAKAFLDTLPSMDRLLPMLALTDIEDAAREATAKRIKYTEKYGDRYTDKYYDRDNP